MAASVRDAARWLRQHVCGSESPEDVLARAIDTLDREERDTILSCWQLWARDNQLRPQGSAPIWLRSAGRGEGKTRSAAEDTLDIMEDWGPAYRGILCSKTIGDVRDVMIQGESGLVACASRRGYTLKYHRSDALVKHPAGGVAYMCTSEKPDKPRGYQSNHFWGDEISSWQNPITTLDNIMFGWRLPVPDGHPLATLTTTPKPNPIMFRLMKDPAWSHLVTISYGSTLDNRANLAPATVAALEAVYKGTRLGRQELEGILLETIGAIVDQDTIHRHRVRQAPVLGRKVVALDPSITAKDDSDEAGIVVVGSDLQTPADAYLLDDQSLASATFGMWARKCVELFVAYDCDCVVAEVNQGGGGIAEAIQVAAAEVAKELGRDELIVPVRSVWARESKRARAEPVGALYERGRIHHVGYFEALERETTSWMPGMASPNRMDALVHGVAHLLLGDRDDVGPISSYWT